MRVWALAMAVAMIACSREPAPVPVPATTVEQAGGLRPLTSRDASGESASRPSESLPPGHPPLGAVPAVAAGKAISGRVELAPSLSARRGAAVYVIARSASTQTIVAVGKDEPSTHP